MPTYIYRREDGTTFEYKQSMASEPLEVCPITGQKVVRLIVSANFKLNGSGFYSTDNRS